MFHGIRPGGGKQPNQPAMDRAIAALQAGDRDAMQTLYAESATAVYAYALSLLKNASDAEDVLHDCYVRAFAHAASYRSHNKPMAWLLTIAKNLCYSILRERSRFAPSEESDLSAADFAPPEQRIVLEACMRQLSERERQIVVLHAVSGLKHREIAALLSLSLGTVLSQYRRAIGKLRAKLEQEGIEA